jgi:hypothetical protein
MQQIKLLFASTATVAIVLGATPLRSAESKLNVQDLYRQCTKPALDAERTFCVAFISGIAEQMIATGFGFRQRRAEGGFLDRDDRNIVSFLSACTRASFGAMVQAFVNWAEKHPEKWSTSRQLGVMMALRETWPCE